MLNRMLLVTVIYGYSHKVNEELVELIKASESNTSALDWTNLPDKSVGGYTAMWTMIGNPHSQANSSRYTALEKSNRVLIYIFGLFLLMFEFMVRVVKRLKPTRVGSTLTWAKHTRPSWIYSHMSKAYVGACSKSMDVVQQRVVGFQLKTQEMAHYFYKVSSVSTALKGSC